MFPIYALPWAYLLTFILFGEFRKDRCLGPFGDCVLGVCLFYVTVDHTQPVAELWAKAAKR